MLLVSKGLAICRTHSNKTRTPGGKLASSLKACALGTDYRIPKVPTQGSGGSHLTSAQVRLTSPCDDCVRDESSLKGMIFVTGAGTLPRRSKRTGQLPH